jgi:hypothetical protein
MIRARATNEEFIDLLAAVGRNCSCPVGPLTGKVILCAVHRLLADEQALSRLLFYRRYAGALLHGEWTIASGWARTRSERTIDIGVF